MKHIFIKTSAHILFGLLWFGVLRQDTFAELIADTKNAKAASENNFNDYHEIFYEQPGHMSDHGTPHAIVETIIRQTVYVPLQPSHPSSHIKDIFFDSSRKRDVEFGPMNKPAETVWPSEMPAAILNSRLPVTPSPYLSFKDLLESMQLSEVKGEEYIPYTDPLIISAPEEHKAKAHVNDVDQPEYDIFSSSFWETDDEGYYVPHIPKSPKSQSSYKDLLLELSPKKHDVSSSEETSKIFPSSVSSFDASADSDKLPVNSKVAASSSDDTTPSGGSNSTQPSALEKFLKSILPIFLSPASFDITFPGNETESKPLTETTKTLDSTRND